MRALFLAALGPLLVAGCIGFGGKGCSVVTAGGAVRICDAVFEYVDADDWIEVAEVGSPAFQWEQIALRTTTQGLHVALNDAAKASDPELVPEQRWNAGQLHAGDLQVGQMIRFCHNEGGARFVIIEVIHTGPGDGRGATGFDSLRAC